MKDNKPQNRRHLSENKIGIVGAKKKAEKDKKKPVTAYITKGRIDDIGGIESAREIAYNALMRAKKK